MAVITRTSSLNDSWYSSGISFVCPTGKTYTMEGYNYAPQKAVRVRVRVRVRKKI